MKLAMAMKVRDEESILEENLRAHLALGIDLFVIIDHRSGDRTPEILRRFQDGGYAHVTREESEGYHDHEYEWSTRLSRQAAELGADWILHADADEFWLPLAGDLKAALGQVPEGFSAMLAPRVEFVPRPDGPAPFFERMTVRERWSRVQPKIAHRASAEAVIPTGPHRVIIPGTQGPTHAGRASLRGGRDEVFDRSNLFTPTAPVWPVRILHFPLRSYDQFRRRAELGLFGTGRTTDRARARATLEAYEAGKLEEAYAELSYDEAAVASGIAAGELVEDTSLKSLLEHCPDPIADPDAFAAFAPAATTTADRQDLEELARDAMQAVARTESLYYVRLERQRERANRELERREHQLERIARLRERNAEVRRRLKRTQRRLREMRGTRWWRAGRRLARVPFLGRVFR
jgi:hypothetical protein